jgi:hypothetical protein
MKLFQRKGFETPKEEKPATPKEAVVERLVTKEQMEAWDKIKDDKHLRGLLAEFTRGHLNKRAELVPADVKDFLHKYPNLENFRRGAKEMIDEFLDNIGINNGAEKRAQYEQKLQEFMMIMYGRNDNS